MKNRILNLLLIGSIVSSVILSSCSKDDDDNNSSGGGTNPSTNGETGTFTDNRDSKTYKWVKIGDQVWMAENLNYTGSGIQHITDATEWDNNSDYDGWCYYDNNSSNGTIYGALYQWEAAKRACPSGWHLPTDAEWTTLTDYLGGINVAGGKMKEIGTTHWNSPNTGADNSSGFSALPGGLRSSSGNFLNLGNGGLWWSAAEYSSNDAYYRYLTYNHTEVYHISDGKSHGYSVRCVRD